MEQRPSALSDVFQQPRSASATHSTCNLLSPHPFASHVRPAITVINVASLQAFKLTSCIPLRSSMYRFTQTLYSVGRLAVGFLRYSVCCERYSLPRCRHHGLYVQIDQRHQELYHYQSGLMGWMSKSRQSHAPELGDPDVTTHSCGIPITGPV